MCGIAGFIRDYNYACDENSVLHRMCESLHHRGPDAAGHYITPEVALCHRRLSILDLSDTGSQPMHSHSGRYTMVYNGEVYNFSELRLDLQKSGSVFRGSSDSEVLLALYERDGVKFLDALNGMFALAIWDNIDKSLFLARDRLGKKPLYFYRKEDHFIFASEIRAILCMPGLDTRLRIEAIQDYFTYQYVPDPKSIYQHIHKLAPGHWMRVDSNGIQQHQYWDVSFASTDTRSQSDIENELYALFEDSVRIRMVSDVPLGAFLSGGVDSSAIVGMMASKSSNKVTTCSVGFNSREYDEVDEARRLASSFGTDHHEFTVSDNVEDSLLEIASWFDEPFSDPSFVPTYFVSKLARKRVTVALSGDGGDENFAGYSKYLTDQTENSLRSCIPGALRKVFLPGMSRMLDSGRTSIARRGASLLNTLSVEPDQGFAISNSFFSKSLWDSLVVDELKKETQHYDPAELTRYLYQKADTDQHLSRLLYVDLKSYLPGDVLVKVDRMSMANSLETRAPLLDYRLVEFAARVPPHLKIRSRKGKFILKQTVSNLLPAEVLERRKKGFSVPLAQWLRKEICEVSEQHLFALGSGLSNYFDISILKKTWDTHQSGNRDYSSELWSLLMFELWWQRQQQYQVRS